MLEDLFYYLSFQKDFLTISVFKVFNLSFLLFSQTCHDNEASEKQHYDDDDDHNCELMIIIRNINIIVIVERIMLKKQYKYDL